MKKTSLCIVLAMLLCLTLFAGCGTPAPAPTDAPAAEVTANPDAQAKLDELKAANTSDAIFALARGYGVWSSSYKTDGTLDYYFASYCDNGTGNGDRSITTEDSDGQIGYFAEGSMNYLGYDPANAECPYSVTVFLEDCFEDTYWTIYAGDPLSAADAEIPVDYTEADGFGTITTVTPDENWSDMGYDLDGYNGTRTLYKFDLDNGLIDCVSVYATCEGKDNVLVMDNTFAYAPDGYPVPSFVDEGFTNATASRLCSIMMDGTPKSWTIPANASFAVIPPEGYSVYRDDAATEAVEYGEADSNVGQEVLFYVIKDA